MMAYIEREVTSRRASVRRSMPRTSRTNQLFLIREEEIVDGDDGVGIAGGFDEPEAEVEFVGAEMEDGVVEFAGELKRTPRGALREGGFD